MAIQIRRRARNSEDRAGDPFEGLVNLFELGVVLAVGFMLAALSALDLEERLAGEDPGTVEVRSDAPPRTVEMSGRNREGRGVPIGRAFRMEDGRTIIVEEP